MEDEKEKIEYLNRVFNLARVRGLCRTQAEFAELIGINPSTISGALKGGRYLTGNLIRRIKIWSQQAGLEDEEKPAEVKRPPIQIPAETMEMYTAMAKSIDRLTALVERMQPGGSAYTGALYSPKNFQADGK